MAFVTARRIRRRPTLFTCCRFGFYRTERGRPGYEQKRFPEVEKRGKLRLIASRDGAEGSVKINQDARLFVSLLMPEEEVTQTDCRQTTCVAAGCARRGRTEWSRRCNREMARRSPMKKTLTVKGKRVRGSFAV